MGNAYFYICFYYFFLGFSFIFLLGEVAFFFVALFCVAEYYQLARLPLRFGTPVLSCLLRKYFSDLSSLRWFRILSFCR